MLFLSIPSPPLSLIQVGGRFGKYVVFMTGGRLDYGEEHSKACGHSHFGPFYEQGHYPEWERSFEVVVISIEDLQGGNGGVVPFQIPGELVVGDVEDLSSSQSLGLDRFLTPTHHAIPSPRSHGLSEEGVWD